MKYTTCIFQTTGYNYKDFQYFSLDSERKMNTRPIVQCGNKFEEIEIMEILLFLWKQRAIVLLYTGIGLGAAVAYATIATPIYEANTIINQLGLLL